MQFVDVAVIGAGVLGCAIARELGKYKLDAVVLERASDVGEGSSKANSGVVHAGFHPRGGSLKGTSCVQGNALFTQLCADLQVPFDRCGGMMVAFEEHGMEKIREKAARAKINGASDLPIVSGEEARALEPRLSSRVIAAMMAPTTGVVSPFALVLACAQNALSNGVRFEFNWEVERMERFGSGWRLHAKDGRSLIARSVINAAGDAAATLDAQVAGGSYVVKPRIGEWVVFDKQDPSTAIKHVIYQAAESDEGGTLIAPTVDGNLLVGPTSRNVRSFFDTATSPEGMEHVLRVGQKVIPDLDKRLVIANFAGVRTNIVNVPKELKDFVVRLSGPRFISALGIKNPGMTSSPALALHAVKLLAEDGIVLEEKPVAEYTGTRRAYVPFLRRTPAEQAELLAKDASYGRLICRCEQITAGDVHAIMQAPLPPTTVTGLKHRLRCTMGRCQGAFCMPHVAALMASELGIPVDQVLANEAGGHVVKRSVK